jgi:hypothetical protein
MAQVTQEPGVQEDIKNTKTRKIGSIYPEIDDQQKIEKKVADK